PRSPLSPYTTLFRSIKDFSPTENPYRYSTLISASASILRQLASAPGVLGVAKEITSLILTEKPLAFRILYASSGSEAIILTIPKSDVSATLQAETLIFALPRLE